MLNQNKKTKFSHLRRLFVLPSTICVVLSFSIKTMEVKASAIIREKFEKPSIANQTVSDTIPKSKTSDLKTPVYIRNATKAYYERKKTDSEFMKKNADNTREWRKKNKEKHNEYQKQWIAKQKELEKEKQESNIKDLENNTNTN